MRLNTLNVVLLVAIIATVVSIVVQKILPDKTLIAIPSNRVSFLYKDASEGSDAKIEWIDQGLSSWRCTAQGTESFLLCSFYLMLATDERHGWDLSSYSKAKITINYSGQAQRLRVVLRTFDPRFSSIEDSDSTKFHFTTLRPDDFNRESEINLREFTVSDWWIESRDLPRALVYPDLSNVVYFGLEFTEGIPAGSHDVFVEKLVFTGEWISAEKWYLSVLVFWMLVGMSLIIVRIVKLHHQTKLAQLRIKELANTNVQLSLEKDQFQALSHLDSLTGIFNRYAIDKAIEHLNNDARHSTTAFILTDIDHFKQINDTHGHDVGDQVLKQFAQVVASNIRQEDIFGRWGGEEFILICPHTSLDKAFYLAEKIRIIVSETTYEKKLAVTASFGVGLLDKNETFEHAFKRLDAALYQAKSFGRNCTIIANPELLDVQKNDT